MSSFFVVAGLASLDSGHSNSHANFFFHWREGFEKRGFEKILPFYCI